MSNFIHLMLFFQTTGLSFYCRLLFSYERKLKGKVSQKSKKANVTRNIIQIVLIKKKKFNVTILLPSLEIIMINGYWHLDPMATDYKVLYSLSDFFRFLTSSKSSIYRVLHLEREPLPFFLKLIDS